MRAQQGRGEAWNQRRQPAGKKTATRPLAALSGRPGRGLRSRPEDLHGFGRNPIDDHRAAFERMQAKIGAKVFCLAAHLWEGSEAEATGLNTVDVAARAVAAGLGGDVFVKVEKLCACRRVEADTKRHACRPSPGFDGGRGALRKHGRRAAWGGHH